MKKLFVVMFLFLAAGLYAQQKFALVIGNGDYRNVTKLNNPVNDNAVQYGKQHYDKPGKL